MLCSALVDAEGFSDMKPSEHGSPFFRGLTSIVPSCVLHKVMQ